MPFGRNWGLNGAAGQEEVQLNTEDVNTTAAVGSEQYLRGGLGRETWLFLPSVNMEVNGLV